MFRIIALLTYMEIKKRILRGGSIIMLFNTLVLPLGYFIRLLYARTLSIEQFGLFYAVMSFFLILSTYSDLNLGYSVIYYLPKYLQKKDYKTCWNMYAYNQIVSIIVSLIFSCIVIFSAPFLVSHYFKVAYGLPLIYTFIFFFLINSIVSTIHNLLSGLQQEEYYSLKEFLRLFFTVLFSVILWLFKRDSLYSYAVAWSAAYGLTALVYIGILLRKNGFLINKITWDTSLAKKMVAYSFPTLITTLIGTFATADIIFLTILRGVREVGIYNIILPIVSIAGILLTPLSSFFYPFISHMREIHKEKTSHIIEQLLHYVPFAVLYFSLFIFLFPDASVTLLFGAKWASYARLPLQIMCIDSILFQLFNYLSIISLGLGLVKQRLIISVVTTALHILISYALISSLGILGAVIANFLYYGISALLFSVLLRKKVDFKYPFLFYGKTLFFSCMLFLLTSVLRLQPTNWPQFLGFGFLYTLIMACFALYLKLLKTDDILAIIKRYRPKNTV